MTRYLLMMAMVVLTPPKGSGGLPHAPRPAVVEARVWDKLAAALLSWSQRMTIERITPHPGL